MSREVSNVTGSRAVVLGALVALTVANAVVEWIASVTPVGVMLVALAAVAVAWIFAPCLDCACSHSTSTRPSRRPAGSGGSTDGPAAHVRLVGEGVADAWRGPSPH
jgi:hypothetical protein